jgi:hypothetical protein
MALGPVQLLLVGFDRPDFDGEILAELATLRENDLVRVIDVLVVRKGTDGVVERLPHPGAADGGGDLVAALIGLDSSGAGGDDAPGEDLWSLDDAIPDDSAAAIALVEHRWAIRTRDAIRAAGGVPLADAWVHPDDLAAAGVEDRT